MDKTDPAVAKLQEIRKLWEEQERAVAGSREHEALIEKIRVSAAEYEALVEAAKKRGKPE